MTNNKKNRRIEVILPDGTVFTGTSFLEIERRLREDLWNPSGSRAFRAEMANRAKNWSGTEVDVELVSYQFLEQLAKAGLMSIFVWEIDEKEEK